MPRWWRLCLAVAAAAVCGAAPRAPPAPLVRSLSAENDTLVAGTTALYDNTAAQPTPASRVVEWAPVVNEGVDGYVLAARAATDPPHVWREVEASGGGLLGARGGGHAPYPVQVVSVRVDGGSAVTQGTFQLSLSYGGVNALDPDSVAITPRIAHDATAADVKAALEALENVHTVEVRRCDQAGGAGGTGGWVGGCPYGGAASGAFAWHVVFVPWVDDAPNYNATAEGAELTERRVAYGGDDGPLNPRTHLAQPMATVAGGLPRLAVHATSLLDGAWTGGGNQVNVAALVAGATTHPSLCGVHEWVDGTALSAAPPPSGVCAHRITGLAPGLSYAFRVRAHAAQSGWGPWSAASAYAAVPRADPPGTPPAPTLAGASAARLSVHVAAPRTLSDADRPHPAATYAAAADARAAVSAFDAQYRAHGSGTWLGLARAEVQSGGWATATATALAPSTAYEFRCRAVNAYGASPWSSPSLPLRTAHDAPAAPGAPALSRSAAGGGRGLVATFAPLPYDRWAPPVESYEVEYRLVGASAGAAGTAAGWRRAGAASALVAHGTREVQAVTTRADAAANIASGTFSLQLVHAGSGAGRNGTALAARDPSRRSVTPPLRFDASAAEVAAALGALTGVGGAETLDVRRHRPGNPSSSAADGQGGYTWRVAFGKTRPAPEAPGSDYGAQHEAVPLLAVRASTLGAAWSGGGPQVVVERLQAGSKAAYSDSGALTLELDAAVLAPYSRYEARVRAVSAAGGTSAWSPASSSGVRTLPAAPGAPAAAAAAPGGGNVVLEAAAGRAAPRTLDTDYPPGAAVGGLEQAAGTGGAAVLVAYVRGQAAPSRTVLFDSAPGDQDGEQRFVVPAAAAPAAPGSAVTVTLKLWGGGGGGAGRGHGADDGEWARGGGGGYTQATVAAVAGEVLLVCVGGGGEGGTGGRGGRGGQCGGGLGGNGEWGGGGGGGATGVVRASTGAVLAVAGGGGGGGATDYCCAHGGAGAGGDGGDGAAPGLATPVDNAGRDVRDEYTAPDCEAGDCVDVRDTEGSPARHAHLDGGRSPGADYAALAVGGGGGSAAGAGGGAAGAAGSYAVAMEGTVGAAGTDAVGLRKLQGGIEGGGSATNGLVGGATYARAGGRGGGGKEGGGGGGGGYAGGGGGGSGVDGAGGGGGGGYVSEAALFSAAVAATYPPAPTAPVLVDVNATSALVAWGAAAAAAPGHEPRSYDVELTGFGHGADDFERYAVVSALEGGANGHPAGTSTCLLEGLSPGAPYRVRVRAHARRGSSFPSASLDFVAGPPEADAWARLETRNLNLLDARRGAAASPLGVPHMHPDAETMSPHPNDPALSERYADAPNADRPAVRPSARRGHTLTALQRSGAFGETSSPHGGEAVYLFGGWAEGTDCDAATSATTRFGGAASGLDVEKCRHGAGSSSELWALDPATLEWTDVAPAGTLPPGREQHSASAVDGELVVFGGVRHPLAYDAHGDVRFYGAFDVPDVAPEYLGDVWTLDPGEATALVVEGNETLVGVPDDAGVRYTVAVAGDGGAAAGVEMCVADVDVGVTVDHPCTRDLRVSLFGPGPNMRSAHEAPNRRAYETVLFDGTLRAAPDGPGCGANLARTVFDDEAAVAVDADAAAAPYAGPHRPLSRLSAYDGLPVAGEWALSVADAHGGDAVHGTLLEWELSFTLVPCARAYRWTDRTAAAAANSPATPPPRARHAALALDGAVFVAGGERDGELLADLWRYDVAGEAWTELEAAAGDARWRRSPVGRALFLGPAGLLAFGGYGALGAAGAGVGYEGRVWHYDPADERWNVLDGLGVRAEAVAPYLYGAVGDRSKRGAAAPALAEAPMSGRYLGAVAYLPRGLGEAFVGGGGQPTAVLFGGQDGARVLGDARALALAKLAGSNAGAWADHEAWRAAACAGRGPGTTYAGVWDASCGAAGGGGEPCGVAALVHAAWCAGAWQSVQNL